MEIVILKTDHKLIKVAQVVTPLGQKIIRFRVKKKSGDELIEGEVRVVRDLDGEVMELEFDQQLYPQTTSPKIHQSVKIKDFVKVIAIT